MAETVTIARPYAHAVFRLARESNALTAWSEKLALLAAVARDPSVAALVSHPKFSAEELAGIFTSVSGDAPGGEGANFVSLLAKNDRLAALPEIAALYEELKSKEEGVKEAVIHSAYAMDDTQLQGILPKLEAHFKTKLRPTVVVEPELLGGMTVAVGDEVLDASVRGKMNAMAVALKN